jgi:hypothetical protein
MSQNLPEIHFHNFNEVNEKMKFSKHLEHILEICIKNNKYFPPTHFSKVFFFRWATPSHDDFGKNLDDIEKRYFCIQLPTKKAQ